MSRAVRSIKCRQRLALSAIAAAACAILVWAAPAAAEPPSYQWSFGEPGSGPGQFVNPAAVEASPSGDLWVVDRGNNRIQEFNAAGEYLTEFGTEGYEEGDMENPVALAIDAEGHIWVADAGLARVDEFAPSGEFIGMITGIYGPEGLAFDGEGNLWVSSYLTGHLYEYEPDGELVRTVGEHGTAEGDFEEATGVAVGPEGDIWATDWALNRVEVYGPTGEFIRQFGELGTGPGKLERPDGIAVDPDGNVWVEDVLNSRIDEFNNEGEFVAFVSASSPSRPFSFNWPSGIATDPDGHLFVVSGSTVERWRLKESSLPACQKATLQVEVGTPFAAPSGTLECEGKSPLAYAITAGPEHGEITGINSETGSFTYTPTSGYVGPDSFMFRASNELGASGETVTHLKVGHPAVCEAGFRSVPSGTASTIHLPCEGSVPMEYEITEGPSHGTTSGLNAETGVLTYEPESEFVGYDSFYLRASNGFGFSSTAKLRLAVGEPATCHSGGAATPESTALAIELPCSGSSPLEYEIQRYPEHGEISEFDPETGELTYTPQTGYLGRDSFEFTATNPLGISTHTTYRIDDGERAPVTEYLFDEGSGSILHDSSRGHDGTITGATWIDDGDQPVLSFNAAEENLVAIPDAPDLHFGNFTVEAWVTPNESLSGAPVVSKVGPSGGFALYAGGVEAAGQPEAVVFGPSGEVISSVTDPNMLETESGHQLAMTNDGTTLKLFVDGELAGTSGGWGGKSEEGALDIGGNEGLGYFDGSIQRVRVFSRALDEAELLDAVDPVPPELELRGPLAEAAEGPLGVNAANLEILASDGSAAGASGLSEVGVKVGGSYAEWYPCPCASPLEFTYERSVWGPWSNEITVTAVDNAGNSTTKSLEVDVREGPSLILSGSLYARRGKSITNPHVLTVRAVQTDGSSEAPRPGVKEVSAFVGGSPLGEPELQECELGNCALEGFWTLDPEKLSEGRHTVVVKAVDQRGMKVNDRSMSSSNPVIPALTNLPKSLKNALAVKTKSSMRPSTRRCLGNTLSGSPKNGSGGELPTNERS